MFHTPPASHAAVEVPEVVVGGPSIETEGFQTPQRFLDYEETF